MKFPVNIEGRPEAEGDNAAPALGADSDAPRLVIRGKSPWEGYDEVTGEKVVLVPHGRKGDIRLVPIPSDTAHPYAAITDWLNFTFRYDPQQLPPGQLLQTVFRAFGQRFAPAVQRRAGKHNYEHAFKLGESGAIFCYGGNCSTALFSLSGEACGLVLDWNGVVAFARDELKGHITRWDGAVDDYLGLHTVDDAVRLHQEGLFGAGGREPKLRQVGNWVKPDGSGRTAEIGKREHGKRLCVYEKGMELDAKNHPWVRWELSLGNKNRVIPWDVLLEPGRYVAGAYPKALTWVADQMSRTRTLQKQTQLSYEAAVRNAAHQVGALLNLMLKVELSAEAVVAKLLRPGIPRRVRHPAVENPEGWIE